jgi:GAF domain-containing protein
MEKEPLDKHLICEVIRYPQIKQDLNERLLQQAAVARLGQRALAVTDLSTLMNETVRLVAETMQVDFCMILKVLPEGQELLLVAGVGWKEGATGATRVSSRNESHLL